MADRRPTDQRPLVVAAVVGVVAVIAAALLASPGEGDDAGPGDQGGCVPLVVSSSTEKGDLIAELGGSYRAAREAGTWTGGRCAEVRVHELTSGKGMDALARDWAGQPADRRPQVWLPTTSLWADQLDLLRPGTVAERRESVATSALVLALPAPMAEEMRLRRGGDIGWADIREAAVGTGPWSAGHPEWGRFKLGKDHPRYSSSGLSALIATYHAARVAAGRTGALVAGDLTDPSVTRFVHDVESSVAHYNDDGTAFMVNLFEAAAQGDPTGYVTAVGVQEQLVYLYNRGSPSGDPAGLEAGRRPAERLVAMPPRDGTVVMDHPYVVLASASPEQREAAADFHAWLRSEEARRRFADLGFRDGSGAPTRQLVDTVGADPTRRYEAIDLPGAGWVRQMLDGWNAIRRTARVLLVIDTSGTMGLPIDPHAAPARSRLDLLKPAARAAIDLLGDRDQVEVWTFPGAGDEPFTRVMPLAPLAEVRDEVGRRVDALTAEGQTTPLHRVTRAAHDQMRRSLDVGSINAVVLLSDGVNDDPVDTDEARLLDDIDADALETSVRVFTVTYGPEDGFGTMQRIAQRTKAHAYDARDPRDIEQALVSVFTTL